MSMEELDDGLYRLHISVPPDITRGLYENSMDVRAKDLVRTAAVGAQHMLIGAAALSSPHRWCRRSKRSASSRGLRPGAAASRTLQQTTRTRTIQTSQTRSLRMRSGMTSRCSPPRRCSLDCHRAARCNVLQPRADSLGLQAWDEVGEAGRLIAGSFQYSDEKRSLEEPYTYTAEAVCLPDLEWSTPHHQLQASLLLLRQHAAGPKSADSGPFLQLELIEVSSENIAEVASMIIQELRDAGEPEVRLCCSQQLVACPLSEPVLCCSRRRSLSCWLSLSRGRSLLCALPRAVAVVGSV